MKNIWILIAKYNAFFLFVLFFGLSFLILVQNNHFQRSSVFNSSHHLVGKIYAASSNWKDYLSLRETNRQLSEENALMRAQLQDLKLRTHTEIDSVVRDTVYQQHYRFIAAKVINNSIHQKNNYITINKGSLHGIKKGMGVISPTGVVGIVLNVSQQFATIQSLLHSETRVSAMLSSSQVFGSLIWGEKINPKRALLRDIPNHVEVKAGEEVNTSGYSLFPQGIPLGKVTGTDISSGESFLDIEIELSTDFHDLQYVYVVIDQWDEEKKHVEAQNTEDN